MLRPPYGSVKNVGYPPYIPLNFPSRSDPCGNTTIAYLHPLYAHMLVIANTLINASIHPLYMCMHCMCTSIAYWHMYMCIYCMYTYPLLSVTMVTPGYVMYVTRMGVARTPPRMV